MSSLIINQSDLLPVNVSLAWNNFLSKYCEKRTMCVAVLNISIYVSSSARILCHMDKSHICPNTDTRTRTRPPMSLRTISWMYSALTVAPWVRIVQQFQITLINVAEDVLREVFRLECGHLGSGHHYHTVLNSQ